MGATPPDTDFGVVIVATARHFHWLRGTCASIRYFMADTPICVLVDDDHLPDDLVATYGVTVLSRYDVEPKKLRDVSFWSLRAKNAALWAAPFETFLLLDCDTVVWGDVRGMADFERYDFVLNSPGRQTLAGVMDVDAVEERIPGFDARGHVGDYVNTGAYFARRGTLDLDRYLELIEISRRNPGMLKAGDQGLFNLMVFRAADEGTVRIHQREIQIVVGRTDRTELVRRFSLRDSRPVVVGDPVVIHWASTAKPSVRERGEDFFAPMTYFRLKYRLDARRNAGWAGVLRLRFEDMLCTDRRGANVRARIVRGRRRVRHRWERLKIRIRRRIPDRIVVAIRRR